MVEPSFKLLAHTSTQVGSYLYIIGGHNGEGYTSQVLLFNLGKYPALSNVACQAISLIRIYNLPSEPPVRNSNCLRQGADRKGISCYHFG